MEAITKVNFIRMSPRKMRLVANEVRGYVFSDAMDVLKHVKKKASDVILKGLRSAGANAKVINPDVQENELYIKKIYVDAGPVMKRFRFRARGRGARIRRRLSKLTIVLSDE